MIIGFSGVLFPTRLTKGLILTEPFWNPSRVRRISLAVILAILSSFFLSLFLNQDAVLLRRGDFPGLYAAALAIEQGLGVRLYDAGLQREIENRHWPELNGHYLYFSYPVFFAVWLLPLAFLPALVAKHLFVVLMMACVFFSVRLARSDNPLFKRDSVPVIACYVGFFPLLMGVLGGQNVALGMLLYSAAIRYFSKDNRAGDFGCGVCLGLWLYKPQYGLALILLFLAGRRFRIAAAALGMAFVQYILGAWVAGFRWPLTWLSALPFFAAQDFGVNQNKMISIVGFLKAFGDAFEFAPIYKTGLYLTGLFLSLLLAFGLVWGYWSAGKIQESTERQRRFKDLFYLTGPALVLLSPHTLFYDLGICILPAARFLNLGTDKAVTFFVGGILLINLVVVFREQWAFSPLLFAAVYCLAMAAKGLRPRARHPPS